VTAIAVEVVVLHDVPVLAMDTGIKAVGHQGDRQPASATAPGMPHTTLVARS
jgi:hypothetical protein